MPEIKIGDDWGFQEEDDTSKGQQIVDQLQEQQKKDNPTPAPAAAPPAPEGAQAPMPQQGPVYTGGTATEIPTTAEGYEQVQKEAAQIDNPLGQLMEDATVAIKAALDPNRDQNQVQSDRQEIRNAYQLERENPWEDTTENRKKALEETWVGKTPILGQAAGTLQDTGEIIGGGLAKAGEDLYSAAGVVNDLLDSRQYGSRLPTATNLVTDGNGETVPFASTFNSPLNPEDDVFSNQYEAASIDLNSSQYAQTGAGAVAKEFVAFGATLYLTGGFKGSAAIPGMIKAVKSGQGLKGAALAAVRSSAVRGFFADFAQDPESSNLSRTIRDNAPEWYPDWLTFLANDENNPALLNRILTGIEGMGLGEAADGLIVAARGINRWRKALNAGKGADEALDEATVAAFEAEEAVRKGQEFRNPNWGNIVRRPQNRGYFQNGNRNINELDNTIVPYQDLYEGKVQGFTVDPTTGAEVTDGYMVALAGKQGTLKGEFTPQAIDRFLEQNAEFLSRDDVFIGGYIDADGIPVMEIAHKVSDRDEAVRLGVEFDQETIYDVTAGRRFQGIGDPLQGELELVGDAANANKPTGPVDTRGKGKFYHGAASEITQITEDYYSGRNIYGEGLYLTDDTVTANSYTKKNKKHAAKDAKPTVYEVEIPEDARFYDLDEAVTPDIRGRLEEVGKYSEAFQTALDALDQGEIKTIAELMDETRGFSREYGESSDTITEVFDSIREIFQGDGYSGFTHVGGNKAGKGKRNHQVKILWDATQNKLSRYDEPFQGFDSSISKQGELPLDDPKISPPEPYIKTGGVDWVGQTRNEGLKDLQWKAREINPQNTARVRQNVGQPSRTKRVAQEITPDDLTDAAKVAEAPRGSAFNKQPTKAIITKPSMKIIGASADGQKLIKQYTSKEPDLQAIANAAGKTPKEIQDEARRFVDDFNGDVNSLPTIDGEIGVKVFTSPGQVAAKTIIGDMATQLADSVVQVRRLGAAGMDQMPAVVDMVDQMKALLKTYKYTSMNASRTLNNFKIPATNIDIPNPFKKNAGKEVAQIQESSDMLDKLVKDLASGDPLVQKNAEIMAGRLALAGGDPILLRPMAQMMAGVLGKSGLSLFYNSMLSGPKTQMVNTLGNLFNSVYRPATGYLGSYFMEKGAGKIQRQAAAATYTAFYQNMQEAWSMAGRVWENGGMAINDGGRGFVRASESAAQIKLLQKIADGSDSASFKWGVGMTSMMYDFVNHPLMDWPSRFMTTTDEFFKTFVARNEFNTRTWMEAAEMAGDAPTSQIKDVYQNLLQKNADNYFDPTTGAIMDDSLLKAGKEATFQTELEGVAASFARNVEAVPILRVFFPFIKTGHNIMVYTAQHVPLVNLMTKEYHQVMRGTDELAKAQMKGRVAFGTMVIGAAGTMAVSGHLTGNGPADPEQAKLWRKNNRPRSIKLPGTDVWIDYSRLEPFNMILGAVGDVHYGVTTGQFSESQGEYLMQHMLYSISANLTQKSYYQGLIPFAQILQPHNGGERLAQVGAETLNNLIPYAGARRNLTNALNPYMMEFETEMDRIKFQATGGLVGSAAPLYDFIKHDGSPMDAPSGGANSVFPYRIGMHGQDPVKDELEDIGLEISDIEMRSGVELSPAMSSKVTKVMGNGELYKKIKSLQGKKEYQDSKAQALDDRNNNPGNYKTRKEYWFYEETMSIISEARKEAFDVLYATDDDFRIEADKVNARQKRAGNRPSISTPKDQKYLEYLIDLQQK